MTLHRRSFLAAGAVSTLGLASRASAEWESSQRYPDPRVRIIDPSFAKYRLSLAKVERIATGMRWSEGPVWFGDGRFLLWSDIPNNRIMKWDEATGAVSVFRKPSNNSNGNTRDRQGRLLTCEHDARRVTRTEYDGSITVITSEFEGKSLNSPNDIVCRSDGSLWFTDPPFGILGFYEGHKAKPELPTNVYRWDPKTKKLSVVIGDISRPNGLAFSPDETKLYVVEAGVTPRVIRAYDVSKNGTALENGRRQRNAGRIPSRRGRQPVGRLGNGPAWPGWCVGIQPGRKADRPHRPARTMRQRVLRRPASQQVVHVRQHICVFPVCEYAGSKRRLSQPTGPTTISLLRVKKEPLEVRKGPRGSVSPITECPGEDSNLHGRKNSH